MLGTALHSQLIDLGLKGMARTLAVQTAQPAMADQPFDARLGQMLEAEFSDRDNRKFDRLRKAAQFKFPSASLEDLDTKAVRQLDRPYFLNLADCAWIHKNLSMTITGPTGTGKSWLACAMGMQAVRGGLSVYFSTALKLQEDMRLAVGDGSWPKLRRKLTKTTLLIIDDFGLGGVDADLAPTLLEIIDLQSANGGLIITSQYPEEGWYDLISDATVADAMLDRVVHRAHRFALQGESLRKKRGKGS